jgi:hypothetical protein
MQPPTIRAGLPLRRYFAALTEISEEQNRLQIKPDTRRGSVRDLRAKVQAWVDTMTPTQRGRRFTTSEVEQLAGLTGKHGGAAAHHRIAQALRACGFQPRRDWTRAGRNTRFWKLED